MDSSGRLIIPAALRKDGKDFIGETFEETGIIREADEAAYSEGNRAMRRRLAALQRRAGAPVKA